MYVESALLKTEARRKTVQLLKLPSGDAGRNILWDLDCRKLLHMSQRYTTLGRGPTHVTMDDSLLPIAIVLAPSADLHTSLHWEQALSFGLLWLRTSGARSILPGGTRVCNYRAFKVLVPAATLGLSFREISAQTSG